MKENTAVVTARKEVIRGQRMWMVTGLHKFKKLEELPIKYTENSPMMYAENNEAVIMWLTGSTNYYKTAKKIKVGELYEPCEFEEIIKLMRTCGNKLAEINKKLKKENENWKGEEVFGI